MLAYEGYFENGAFFTAGRRTIQLPENKRIIITVLDEPITIQEKSVPQERRLAWLKRLEQAIQESSGEELTDIPRSQNMRPPHGLTIEDWING
jgi:Tfp pilus assembly protein PilZ